MPRFLIDANLPYRFAIWRGPDYQQFLILTTHGQTAKSGAMPVSMIW